MAKTAVGLFENTNSVDDVVRELEASGFPRKDLRVLGEPREMAGSGVLSTPHTDFEVGLIRDLRAFGPMRPTRKRTSKEYGVAESWFSQPVRAQWRTTPPPS